MRKHPAVILAAALPPLLFWFIAEATAGQLDGLAVLAVLCAVLLAGFFGLPLYAPKLHKRMIRWPDTFPQPPSRETPLQRPLVTTGEREADRR